MHLARAHVFSWTVKLQYNHSALDTNSADVTMLSTAQDRNDTQYDKQHIKHKLQSPPDVSEKKWRTFYSKYLTVMSIKNV